MKTYLVNITYKGNTFTRQYQVNELDEVYECVEWDYPGARILGSNAIQRVA